MNPETSLIHFSNPFLVYSGKEMEKPNKKLTLSKFVPIRKTKFNKKIEIIKWIEDLEHNSTIEELLNTVISPVKFEEKGNIWLQTPVSFPATDRDVITLKDELNLKLKNFNAKKYGICFIREEFYFQCFDEIIRQVIINFKKRGFLIRTFVVTHKRLF
jgi:dynein light intermediate chain